MSSSKMKATAHSSGEPSQSSDDFYTTSPAIPGFYFQPDKVKDAFRVQLFSTDDEGMKDDPVIHQMIIPGEETDDFEGPLSLKCDRSHGYAFPGIFIDPMEVDGHLRVIMEHKQDSRLTVNTFPAVGDWGDEGELTHDDCDISLHARCNRGPSGKLIVSTVRGTIKFVPEKKAPQKKKPKAKKTNAKKGKAKRGQGRTHEFHEAVFDYNAANEDAKLQVYRYSHGKTFQFVNAGVKARVTDSDKKRRLKEIYIVHIALKEVEGETKPDHKVYPMAQQEEIDHNLKYVDKFMTRALAVVGYERLILSKATEPLALDVEVRGSKTNVEEELPADLGGPAEAGEGQPMSEKRKGKQPVKNADEEESEEPSAEDSSDEEEFEG